MLHQLDIQRRISVERNLIRLEGERLGGLKETAIDTNRPLYDVYAIRVLRLIRRIAEHDITYRNQYGANRAAMRRRSLGNLAITARLFRDYNNLIPNNPARNYCSQVDGYKGTNIFDDLAYLCVFDIVINQNPLGGPLYNLSDQAVNRVLNETGPVLQEIAEAEINYFQYTGNNCPSNRDINRQLPAGQNLFNIRNRYNNHTQLRQLFITTSYSKETFHISRAIRTINTCINLHLGPPLAQNQIIANKRAVLRSLSIIGEAFTQSNLSPATRSLGVLSQREFQLFKKIRDTLEHSEIDIHADNIERYIAQNDIRPFINELSTLRALLNLKLRELARIYNDNLLGAHYLGNNLNNNNLDRFLQIRGFFENHLRQLTDALLVQHKQQHPNDFTPQAMADRIRLEIAAINLLLVNAQASVIQALQNHLGDAACVVEFLQLYPAIRLSIEYHMCRIVKFLGEIPVDQQANLLAPMQEAEIRVFRNIIAHDINEVMITGIPLEGFIYRYLAIIFQRFPLQQGQQHVPPNPGII